MIHVIDSDDDTVTIRLDWRTASSVVDAFPFSGWDTLRRFVDDHYRRTTPRRRAQ